MNDQILVAEGTGLVQRHMRIEAAILVHIVDIQRAREHCHQSIIEWRLAAMLGEDGVSTIKDLYRQLARLSQVLHESEMPELVMGFKDRRRRGVCQTEGQVEEQDPLQGTERNIQIVESLPGSQCQSE